VDIEQRKSSMSKQSQHVSSTRDARRAKGRIARTHKRIYAVATLALLAGAVIAAVAFAEGSQKPALAAAENAKLGTQVVVNAQGRTLYALSPETSRRLLCKSDECLQNWPPLTVSSDEVKLKAGAGVQGRLGLIRRGKDRFQVTLRGMPLYRFSGDHGRDESNGDGIESFGGTWHAATSASGAKVQPTQPSTTETATAPYTAPSQAPDASTPSAQPTPTTPTTTTTTTPTYTYPAY
jgi:predicted lipoprotein with Yx(FWY)xxD motif